MKLQALAICTILSVFAHSTSWACDQALKEFPRDCAIQDKFRDIRSRLNRQNVNIEEVAEYRAIRFIHRQGGRSGGWEEAKKNQKGPRWIYDKMPDTWDVWDSGARFVESQFNIEQMTLKNFSLIHKNMLTRGIQDKNTDLKLPPGQIRSGQDDVNGSCYKKICDSNGNCQLDVKKLAVLEDLSREEPRLQKVWESRASVSFVDLVNQSLNVNFSRAPMYAPLQVITQNHELPKNCKDGFWVDYLPSSQVRSQLALWIVFVYENLDRLKQANAPLSPIELAADAQKWMVSIHPFADGNGRFSRILQDLILNHFDLPKAPGGDLQNDVISTRMNYRIATYNKMEDMLNNLYKCVDYYEGRGNSGLSNSEIKMMCSEVRQLSAIGAK